MKFIYFWEWPFGFTFLRMAPVKIYPQMKECSPVPNCRGDKKGTGCKNNNKKKLSFPLLKYATSGEIEVTNKRGRVLIMPTITNVTNNSMNGCYKSDQMVSSNYSFNCKTRGGNECFPGVSKLVMPMHLYYMYYILWQRILKKPMHLLET